MSTPLWITGGRIIDPALGRDNTGDLYVVEGKITADLSAKQQAAARKIDATGLLVCPGLIDIHVHFRDPGQTHKETIQTGSAAAAAGGFTTVVCMPNTTPPCDNTGTIQYVKDAIERGALVNVLVTGTITTGMNGENLAPIGSFKRAGVVAITDDGLCVQNNEIMRRALEYAHMFKLPVMDHCQDASLTHEAVMNEGHWSMRLGLRGWPNSAEDIIVSRNVILSYYSGAHIHLQHISSANSVEIIRQAKQRGVRVTAEATPHHLHLTDEALKSYHTHFKMNPPLRTEKDRQALVQGLRDGAIDCIATDHAPHTDYEKDKEFDYAPNGVIGLETALAVSHEVLVKQEGFSWSQLIELMSWKPAKIMSLAKGTLGPGADADIVLIDPKKSWEVNPADFQSRSANCPWNGKTFTGKAVRTIVGGRTVWDGNRIVETP